MRKKKMFLTEINFSSSLQKSPRLLLSLIKSSLPDFTEESLFISVEKKWNVGCQLLCRKKFRDGSCGVARHLVAYLYKEHGKEALNIFITLRQEEAKTAYWTDNKPLCSHEKASEDIINEKPFAQLELIDEFSVGAKKRSRMDGSGVEVDCITIMSSKTVDFLSLAQVQDYASARQHVSTSMKSAKGHEEPLAPT